MTRTSVSIATVYSSAQCVLSVVGSVGVILLFAGIPQLIYSPEVSVANLMTFLLGAILITTMVAGNSFLNYKYRRFEREARLRRSASNSTENGISAVDPEDKPPSYEAILTSDGLPPDYYTVLGEKPPRYEDIASGIFLNSLPSVPASCHTDPVTSNSVTITSETSASVEVASVSCGLDIQQEEVRPNTFTLDNGINSAAQIANSDKDSQDEAHQEILERSLKPECYRNREVDGRKHYTEEERIRNTEGSIQCNHGALSRQGSQDSMRNLNESDS
ncbi:uncharacterized protein [Panulirus ornatus]|uniref:uncharacterized protein n=1 Tax=Panulirus ornatus TaxID=150431 RepID=UPI003A8506C6